jgi:hypothetical protein
MWSILHCAFNKKEIEKCFLPEPWFQAIQATVYPIFTDFAEGFSEAQPGTDEKVAGKQEHYPARKFVQ